MISFKVYRRNVNGKGKTFITRASFPGVMTTDEVKDRLVKCNGFGKDIIVRRYGK